MPDLAINDLEMIRDVVPQLDLSAIRALRRAGYVVVRDYKVIAPTRTLALVEADEALIPQLVRPLLDHPV